MKQGKIVNKRELAHFFGVSPQAVDGWLPRGCPVLKRGGPLVGYQFDTAAVVEWRSEQRVAEAIGEQRPDNPGDAENRKLSADASLAELKLHRELGQLAKIEDAERIWTRQVSACRTKLLALPSKLAPVALSANSVEEIRSLFERELHEALNELDGGTDPDDAFDGAEGIGESSGPGDVGNQATAEAEAERVGRVKGSGPVRQRGTRPVSSRKG